MFNSLQFHGLQPTRSSVHGDFQARILEWVAIPFSTGSSPPRDHWQADSLPLSHFGSPLDLVARAKKQSHRNELNPPRLPFSASSTSSNLIKCQVMCWVSQEFQERVRQIVCPDFVIFARTRNRRGGTEQHPESHFLRSSDFQDFSL